MRNRVAYRMAAGLLAVAVASAGRADEPKPTPPARVAAGEYVEVDAEGRPNKELLIRVAEVTPNILLLQGRHGWVSFATFDPAKGEYRGSFEFRREGGRGPDGKWADLYQVRVTGAGGVLRVEGKSDRNEMLIQAVPTAAPGQPVGK